MMFFICRDVLMVAVGVFFIFSNVIIVNSEPRYVSSCDSILQEATVISFDEDWKLKDICLRTLSEELTEVISAGYQALLSFAPRTDDLFIGLTEMM